VEVGGVCAVTLGGTSRTCFEEFVVVSERTLVLVKPDGVERGLVGEVIARIERKGLKLAALELRTADRATAEQHYAEHDGKPFYNDLVDFITGGPLVALVVEGVRAIPAFRQLAGGTDPVEKATPGTIRGDFGLEVQYNLVHGSDSPESAEREIKIWFPNL
jgi:nucleoside-diphosphate kinase